MDFTTIKSSVAAQFKAMQVYPLFRVAVEKDDLWANYLASFPEGSNPIYRERTEHDCNCCKQFIRAMGDVVAITPEGRIITLWDGSSTDLNYQAVLKGLAELVRSKPVANRFYHYERTAGTDKSFENLMGEVKAWNHFFVHIPEQNFLPSDQIGPRLSESRSTFDVFLRALREISLESIDTVIELSEQNSLYRGADYLAQLKGFKEQKEAFLGLSEEFEEPSVWYLSAILPQSVTRIRNTAIGTLLVDLSIGRELNASVASFESKVAPTNYKRPTALVTQGMIDKAKKAVEELGLTSALERRYATIDDITVNNILFADRSAPAHLGGSPFDDLSPKPLDPKDFSRVDDVTIDQFIEHILPKAKSLEVMIENSQTPNLVSLIAPSDPTAPRLFKWDNGFSWSYQGELADSIKERVKQAGGNVTGELCCRLAWEYTDDLDFHMKEPNGSHIYFSTYRQRKSPNGGMLDVDANGCNGMMNHPVENIFYDQIRTMKPGIYQLLVNNYSRRSNGQGFEVEIDIMGQVHHINYPKAVSQSATVEVARIEVSNGQARILSSLPSTSTVKEVWGVKTHQFQKVNVVMMSPNYWDGRGIGNKHFFFMLEGCRNEGKARGFFNEFLKSDLDQHRKVMEMVGNKLKTEESDRQLSGLGFSSTQRNSVLCRVQGSFNRIIRIKF
jgi:uncharacterized protein YfaP (DUF2135 family)